MSQHDDLTSTLSRELVERAHAMDGSLLHLADVQGRTRSIRRRRTTTAVAGVAAAVAVIIPVASLATHTSGKPEPAPITQTPSPTLTATDDGHQPPPGVLEVSDLPTGSRPGMEYVTDGKVLHELDGSTVDIPTHYPVSSFTTLTDGTHVFVTAHNGTPYVEVQDPSGAMHDPVRTSWSGLSVTSSHDAAAWIDPDGQVMVWTGATARPLGDPVPVGSGLRISSFGSEDCIPDYCSVFVNAQGGNSGGQPWEVADYATRPYTDGGLVSLADVDGSVVIGRTELTDSSSCSDLFGGGEFAGFHTCKATLMSFSPDHATLLGYLPYWDALGSTSISMWNFKGERLFERKADPKHQAVVADSQWEDRDHVIATVFQENTWSLVRIAQDGSMEYAAPPVHGDDVSSPFVLATGGGQPVGD